MNVYALWTESHEWIRSDQVIRVYTDDTWSRGEGGTQPVYRVRLVCLNGLTFSRDVIGSTHKTKAAAEAMAKLVAREVFGTHPWSEGADDDAPVG